jgi:replicative DNA helicase
VGIPLVGDIDVPHDIQAEQAALGSMMWSAEAAGELSATLTDVDFFRPAHALIFDAIVEMYGRGEAVNAVTAAAELDRRGHLTRAGGPMYLHTLISTTPTAGNGGYYARIVVEKAKARRLVEVGDRIAQRARGPVEDIDRLISDAQEAVYAVTSTRASNDITVVGDLLDQFVKDAEAGEARGTAIAGISSGLVDLDALTDGFRPGEMWIVAARPSVGKTVAGLDFARAAAIGAGLPAAVFSMEMSKAEIMNRLMAAHCRVPLAEIRSGRVSVDNWSRLARKFDDVTAAPLYLDDTPGLTVPEIRAKARRVKARGGLSMVVIDYLQLMTSVKRSENRQQEVTHISGRLKELAMELGIVVIALSQLNRAVEQRADKRPAMHDLRESGSLEQDADGVILLHREEMSNPETARVGEADFIIEKNRSGARGIITVAFQGHYTRFHDMAREERVSA